VGSCLGWFMSAYTILSTRDKHTKSVAILTFISMMGTLLAMMTVLLVTSVLYSVSIGQNTLTNERRGEIACYVDQGLTCTRCNDLINRCPEWTSTDVKKVLQSQAKSSATLAIICVVYAIIALRYGFNARKHLSMYEIEYV
jgi:ABC-type lipoprotein release transport system permease subunit